MEGDGRAVNMLDSAEMGLQCGSHGRRLERQVRVSLSHGEKEVQSLSCRFNSRMVKERKGEGGPPVEVQDRPSGWWRDCGWIQVAGPSHFLEAYLNPWLFLTFSHTPCYKYQLAPGQYQLAPGHLAALRVPVCGGAIWL